MRTLRCLALLVVIPAIAIADGKKLDPAAKAHMDAGLKAYGDKQYEQAAREFELAYQIAPDPSMLYAGAQALRLGGDCAKALPLYRKYLEAQLKDDQVVAAKSGVEICEAKLASEPKPQPKPEPKPEPIAPKPPIEPKPVITKPAEAEPRWYKDPIGGALVGGGVVALGVGIGFYVAGNSSEKKSKSAEFRDDFGKLLDEASSRHKIGAIAMGAGVALAVGGVVVYTLRGRGGGRTTVGTTGQTLFIAGGILMLRLSLLAILLGQAGCKVTGTFACERDEQCRLGGSFGRCEGTGFCSFIDGTCPSGSRYDPLAGDGLSGSCVPDNLPPDAVEPDVPPDPRCTTWVPAPQIFDPCAIPMPEGNLVLTAALSPYRYDTSNGGGILADKDGTPVAVPNISFNQTGGVGVALISVEQFTVDAGATLVVVGAKPLIVAAWTGIDVHGTIDAGSHRGSAGGGANPDSCSTTQTVPTAGANANSTGGSGGGGGGGFQGTGGNGGTGDNPPVAGGIGGSSTAAPAFVRGGCNGAASGTAGTGALAPSDMNTITEAGLGGGGIRLSSKEGATVDGTITAGGSGGAGAPQGSACGGGGGGAGGYVGIEAATSITLTGTTILTANGGGGGGSGPFAGLGSPGTDGQASATAAPGGPSAGTCGVAGSSGSAGAELNGTTSTTADNCGGSGGGGAAGFVLIRAPSFTPATATISPAAITQ